MHDSSYILILKIKTLYLYKFCNFIYLLTLLNLHSISLQLFYIGSILDNYIICYKSFCLISVLCKTYCYSVIYSQKVSLSKCILSEHWFVNIYILRRRYI